MTWRILATVLSGACMALFAPEWNLHGLQWFMFVPMFWALREDTPRHNRWLAFLYGTVAVGSIFWWIVDTVSLFSNIPLPGSIAIHVLFSVAYGLPWLFIWLLVHPFRERMGSFWVLAMPAWVVLVEYVSGFVLLFPYQQGAVQYRVPQIIQLASVTGVAGISFLVLWSNCVIAECVYRWRDRGVIPWRHVAAVTSTVAVVMAFGTYRHDKVEQTLRGADTIRFGQLQSNHGMLWRMDHSARESFEDWRDLTQFIPSGEVDLVVWPEGACPYDLNRGPASKRIEKLAKAGGFDMIVGGGTRERPAEPEMGEQKVLVFNSTYFIDADGNNRGRYDKMIPLPFGEYLPFSEQFPWMWEWLEGPGSFRAGEEAVVFDTPSGKIATPICYEAILSGMCRWFEQPDMLVNVTNDSWFGGPDSSRHHATHQHGMLAALRATELGIPLIRSAYTGVSFVVEPHGNIYAETEAYERVQRKVLIRRATVPTLYARFGDWFVGFCLLLVVGLFRRGIPKVPEKPRWRR